MPISIASVLAKTNNNNTKTLTPTCSRGCAEYFSSSNSLNSSQPPCGQCYCYSGFANEETDTEKWSHQLKVAHLIRDGCKPQVQIQHNDSRIRSLNHQATTHRLVSETCDPRSRPKLGRTGSWFVTRLTPSRKPWNIAPLLFSNCAFYWQSRLGFFRPLHGGVSHGHEQIHGSPPGIHREAEDTEGQSTLSTQLPGTQAFGKSSGKRSCSQPWGACPHEFIWVHATMCSSQGVHVLASARGCWICTGRQARHFSLPMNTSGVSFRMLWSR